jgi:hypothetical protein
MKLLRFMAVAIFVAGLLSVAQGQDASKKKLIEIYRIAPGQHVAFLKSIALFDEANRIAGVPPRDLYVHSDGASWDFILIQPAELTPEQSKAIGEALRKLKAPTGPKFFAEFRVFVAEHTDTFAEGPITAKEWLDRLDKLEKENQ